MNNVREDIDAGEVERAERRALRPAERRAGHGIDFFDRERTRFDLLEDVDDARSDR